MKKRLLVVYVFIALMLVCTNVYAVITMNVGISADKTSVKPGEDFTVTVNVKDISKGISSIEGYINIDENVLKDINKDTIVATDGKIEIKSGDKVTNKLSYAFNPTSTNADYDVIFNTKKENIDNNDCFFVMDFNKEVEGSADLLKLKFQVKESATINEIKDAIKVDFVVAYSSADEAEKSEPVSAALDVKVVKDETQNPTEDDNKNDDNNNQGEDNKNNNQNNDNNNNDNKDQNNNDNGNNGNNNNNDNKDQNQNKNTNTNQNTNRNTNNTTRNNVANNTNTDGTVAGTRIPAAGAGMIMLPIVALVILAYISYNKYIKYKDI